jgi:hypothetical protein
MKKQKQLLFLAIAIGITLLAARCAKIETYYLDQETKDYCLFDVGSYWIFQDSATLKTDSIVIIDIKHDFMHGVSTGYNNVETYDIQYACFYVDTSILISVILQGVSDYFCRTLPYHFESWDSLSRFPYASCFIYNKSMDAYYLSYSISNVTYYEVKQFSNFGYRHHFKGFYAKHVGSIRNEMTTDDEQHIIYNLIRYNVKPYNK